MKESGMQKSEEADMKGIILYSSRYGATERYAKWLAEETGFGCIETKKAKADDVMQYDTIILGGGVYASGISGLSFLKKNILRLQGKRIIVFCVGASPYEEKAFQQLVSHNLKDSLAGLPCYYCRGAWDLGGMSFTDRNLCKMLQKAVAKKKPEDCEIWEAALLEAGNQKIDWTDRSYIAPILEALGSSGQ